MSKAGLQRTKGWISILRELTIQARKQKDDAEIANLFVIPESPLGTQLPCPFLYLLHSLWGRCDNEITWDWVLSTLKCLRQMNEWNSSQWLESNLKTWVLDLVPFWKPYQSVNFFCLSGELSTGESLKYLWLSGTSNQTNGCKASFQF